MASSPKPRIAELGDRLQALEVVGVVVHPAPVSMRGHDQPGLAVEADRAGREPGLGRQLLEGVRHLATLIVGHGLHDGRSEATGQPPT